MMMLSGGFHPDSPPLLQFPWCPTGGSIPLVHSLWVPPKSPPSFSLAILLLSLRFVDSICVFFVYFGGFELGDGFVDKWIGGILVLLRLFSCCYFVVMIWRLWGWWIGSGCWCRVSLSLVGLWGGTLVEGFFWGLGLWEFFSLWTGFLCKWVVITFVGCLVELWVECWCMDLDSGGCFFFSPWFVRIWGRMAFSQSWMITNEVLWSEQRNYLFFHGFSVGVVFD